MDNTQKTKGAVIKTLAIVGFFATAALIIWMLVQGLRFMPGAFASLASLAESLNSYRNVEELTIATEKSVVVSGEQFKLSWTDLRMNGTYEFSYACTEGIVLEVQGDGELVTIPCTQALSLPADVHGLFVSVSSGDERFVDVPLKVAFKREDGETLLESSASVTVVNATIPLAQNTLPVEEIASTTTTSTPTPVVEAPKPVVTPPAPKPVVTPTPKPPVSQVVVTPVPVSNPLGNVDLGIAYLGVGLMNGNTFVPHATFDRSERNGLKFEVKNTGTKTSGTWTFKVNLPSGIVYESPLQSALRPGERVEFTLGFDMDADETAKNVTVKGTVSEKSDTNTKNNSFSWVVGITK